MTFDELFSEHTTTPEEREELLWYLLFLRMRAMMRHWGLRP